jgi:hypothetical protein
MQRPDICKPFNALNTAPANSVLIFAKSTAFLDINHAKQKKPVVTQAFSDHAQI